MIIASLCKKLYEVPTCVTLDGLIFEHVNAQ